MNIYDELGIKKIINAWGTVTKLGGSKMDPEILQAMNSAAESFVDMQKLHTASGRRIAELLGVEACCITCGAAAGLAISTAACMTGLKSSYAYQLPDTTGMKNEVLMLKCHRDLYNQAISLSGAKIVEVGTTSYAFPEQIEDKINECTTAFFFASEAETMRGSISFEEVVRVCNRYQIPVIVDAAAELPPRSNIRAYLDQGASLVVFSGGKEIRGPQTSGMILGKKELIEACDLNCCPNYGIGRPMKIDKENICGLVKAVELFVQKDYDKQIKVWESYARKIYDGLKEYKELELELGYPIEPGVQPTSILRLFIRPLNMSADMLHEKLIAFDPCIYTFKYRDLIVINPQCLESYELQPIIDTIRTIVR